MHDHGSTSSLTKHVPKLKHEACGWMISHPSAKMNHGRKEKKKRREKKINRINREGYKGETVNGAVLIKETLLNLKLQKKSILYRSLFF